MQALGLRHPVPSHITFGTLVPSHIALRHASFGPLAPPHIALRHASLIPSASPLPSAPSSQVLSLPNVLLTRGLRGLWAVHYTAWKMNYGVARPVHLKLQVPNQEVPSYSRTWGTTVCTITDRATS
ncbi:hypothetical protein L3X38_041981 [Prunus dulcis]|uniref:Uncharacterized protein n=1 Tax=Prunus dulcis TaxID=3755 RepID=A0AAD4UVP6_PRUDU|nr:hypothetical protein L3X38_041981 [Prunus dulcis]